MNVAQRVQAKIKFVFCIALIFCASDAIATSLNIFVSADSRLEAEFGQDISKYVGIPANLQVGITKALGPADKLLSLNEESQGSLAILPFESLLVFSKLAEEGNANVTQLLAPIRVIAPLYQSTVYLIARSDSGLFSFHDIENAHINVGTPKGTADSTIQALYFDLFGRSIPDENILTFKDEDALVRMITEKKIDVVAIVGTHPVKVLAEMKPEARQFIRLLKFDETHASSRRVLETFSPTTIRSSSYRNLLDVDLPSISLTHLLIAYQHRASGMDISLRKLLRSWCENSERMKALGSAKWKSLQPPDLVENQLALKSITRLDMVSICKTPNESESWTTNCRTDIRALGLCR